MNFKNIFEARELRNLHLNLGESIYFVAHKFQSMDAIYNSQMGDPITVWGHAGVMSPLQHLPSAVRRTAKPTKAGTPSNLKHFFIQES